MQVLFDQGVPLPLKSRLASIYEVSTAYQKGWSQLRNGELLKAAEQEKFDILVTTDQNLQHEQNLAGRSIAVVVLDTTSWPRIKMAIEAVLSGLQAATPGEFTIVEIPWSISK